MGLYEFNQLDLDAKATTLWEHGQFLMLRIEGEFAINLYSLYDFYVEVWYQKNENRIERFRTFQSINALWPYLDQIDLNLKL